MAEMTMSDEILRQIVSLEEQGARAGISEHAMEEMDHELQGLLANYGDSMARELLSLREAARRDQCEWTEDDPDAGRWETNCGHMFVFNDGGPDDNGFKFCHGCGKSVKVIPQPASEKAG